MARKTKRPSSPAAGHGRVKGSIKGNRYGCGGRIKKSK